MSIVATLDSNKDDLTELIELQTLLFNVTPATLEDTKKKLLSSKFLQSKNSMRRLLDSIKAAFDSRPLTSDCYISILYSLSKVINRFYNSSTLFNSIFQNNYIRLKLFEQDLIDISTIIESSKENEANFVYFSPDIKNADESFFNRQVKCSLSIQEALPSDLDKYRINRERGINEDPIAVAIRSDDVDTFSQIFDGNVNGKITPSLTERCEFLRLVQPSYIGFAAFLGAEKVFSYLMQKNNGEKLSPSLAQFASAGGNMNIINTLEESNVSFDQCLEIAIEFHHPQAYAYIHKRNPYSIESVKASIRSYNIESFVLSLPYLLNINEANDKLQRTVLHVAALYARYDIVKLLSQIDGIDLNAKDIVFFINHKFIPFLSSHLIVFLIFLIY